MGWIEFDLLLGDVRSLKGKRSLIRPLIADLARRYPVSVAEAGLQDLHRRALVGACVAAPDPGHALAILDEMERFVATRPELELLSAHRGMFSSDD